MGMGQVSRLALSHPSPVASHLRPLWVAIPDEHTEFACAQGETCVGCGRPPLEAALRQTLHGEPEALTVIGEDFQSRSGAIAKDIRI
jgi:hypothetical protein